jgi:hypothetical protein
MIDQLRIQAYGACATVYQYVAAIDPTTLKIEQVALAALTLVATLVVIVRIVKSLTGRGTVPPAPPPARVGGDPRTPVPPSLALRRAVTPHNPLSQIEEVNSSSEDGEDEVDNEIIQKEFDRAVAVMSTDGIVAGREILTKMIETFTTDSFADFRENYLDVLGEWRAKIVMLLKARPFLFPCDSDSNHSLLGAVCKELQKRDPDEESLKTLGELRGWVRDTVVKHKDQLKHEISWVIKEVLEDEAESLDDEAKLDRYLNHFDHHPECATLVEFWALRWMFPDLKLEFDITHKFVLSESDDFSFRDPDNKSDNQQAIRLEYFQGVGFQLATSEGGPAD